MQGVTAEEFPQKSPICNILILKVNMWKFASVKSSDKILYFSSDEPNQGWHDLFPEFEKSSLKSGQSSQCQTQTRWW